MKHVAGLMCLSSVYTGVLWIEYQTALLFGVGCFLFAAGSALTLVATALYRAPEGVVQRNGFHVRPQDRRAPSSLHTILSTGACATMRLKLQVAEEFHWNAHK